MDTNELAGSIKVAILLQNLPQERRQLLIDRLGEEDRSVVVNHLEQMGPISPELGEQVAAEFSRAVKRAQSEQPKALPPGTEQDMDSQTAKAIESSGLKALSTMDPDQLAQLIRDEHPQTIAVILVHLKPELASEVMNKLPDEKKTEVALRIANSDKILSEMVDEIEKVFKDILSNKDGAVTRRVGGISQLAEIMNQIEATSAQLIMDEIEDVNPELAAEIKQLMFVFEDLVMVDDKGLQALLRKVETKELAIALKAASEEVKGKIFQNMSTRAAEMVSEEMEAAGSVRMKDVENSQNAITKLIQDMEEKGELVISGRRGEEFIG